MDAQRAEASQRMAELAPRMFELLLAVQSGPITPEDAAAIDALLDYIVNGS